MTLERPTINKDIVYWEFQYLDNMIQMASDLRIVKVDWGYCQGKKKIRIHLSHYFL